MLKDTKAFLAKKPPFIVGDRLQHVHALAALSWIATVSNKRVELARCIETSYVALRRDTSRYHAEWKAGSKAREAAMRARYNQPFPRSIYVDAIEMKQNASD